MIENRRLWFSTAHIQLFPSSSSHFVLSYGLRPMWHKRQKFRVNALLDPKKTANTLTLAIYLHMCANYGRMMECDNRSFECIIAQLTLTLALYSVKSMAYYASKCVDCITVTFPMRLRNCFEIFSTAASAATNSSNQQQQPHRRWQK